MEPVIFAGILGGIGGLTRGVVGLLKALSLRRKIIWTYYAITVAIAVIIGVFVGIIFDFDPRLSLLADEGNRAAKYLFELVQSPQKVDAYVATCQIGITFSSLILGFYGQSQLSIYIAPLLTLIGLSESAASSISA